MNAFSTRTDIVAHRELEVILSTMGADVSGLLTEPNVTDIILNPPLDGEIEGGLWVVRLGEDAKQIGTMSRSDADAFIVTVASSLNKFATVNTAIVSGKLPDGSRFEGVVPPTCEFPVFAIRRRAVKLMSLADYVGMGAMTEAQKSVIEDAVLARRNIVVVGGTGSGKTTLLNAILLSMTALTPTHRYVGIEDVGELQCAAKNRVFFLADEHHPIRTIIRTAMRMFPDRIIVGEVRGPEALDMLMAWNTGHDGGAASFHSNVATPQSALFRLANMVSMATDAPARPEWLIGEAVGLIVCVARMEKGFRRISQIAAVEGFDAAKGAYNLKTIG